MDRSSKAALWSKRLTACERSGLSRRAWCAAHGVNVHTLDYWRSRLRAQPAKPTRPKRRSQALVPIVVGGSAPMSPAPMITLRLPGGIELSAASLEARWLATLVRELGAC